MKKLTFFLCSLIIALNVNLCYAVHSGIYENRIAYSSDSYDVYVTTNLIENQMFNYYSSKTIEMTISKKIKSDSYTEYIKNVIHEYYPPPLWRPESINSMIDSAKANNALWIQEKIYMDFRNRTFTVLDESLWTTEGKRAEVILNLNPEATFRVDYDYVDMDNNPESAGIANASIDFLESIKEIYFDKNKGKEYERKKISTNNYNYYWQYLKANYVKVEENLDLVDLYVDIDSFTRRGEYLEGWIKVIWDEEKVKGHEFKGFNSPPDETLYYCRFDFDKREILAIAAHEKFQNGEILKYVRDNVEIWDEKNHGHVKSLLDKISELYNNGTIRLRS